MAATFAVAGGDAAGTWSPRRATAHRINAVATAITAGMTIGDVGRLDFGYAPPFGPVWDPVLGVAKVLDEKLARRDDGRRDDSGR